jgi:hypothetical protein
MPTVIGHHDVKDKDHWLGSSKREEFFGPLGVFQYPHLRRPNESDASGGAHGRGRHGCAQDCDGHSGSRRGNGT